MKGSLRVCMLALVVNFVGPFIQSAEAVSNYSIVLNPTLAGKARWNVNTQSTPYVSNLEMIDTAGVKHVLSLQSSSTKYYSQFKTALRNMNSDQLLPFSTKMEILVKCDSPYTTSGGYRMYVSGNCNIFSYSFTR